MRTIFVLLAALSLAAAAPLSAQSQSGGGREAADSYADTRTFVYDIEDKYADEHPTARTVRLTLEFTPLSGDVRFHYSCLQASYDQGEAMNTARRVFQDIAGEMGFMNYSYKGKDKTRYYKDKATGQRMAEYSSFVSFTR